MAQSKRKQDLKTSHGGESKKIKLSKSSSAPSNYKKQHTKQKNLVEDSEDEDEYGAEGGMEGVEYGADEGEEEYEEGTEGKAGGNANSNKSRESHAAQKKLANERKQAKPHANIIQRSKKIWERLRIKSQVKPEERKTLTDELFAIITGRVKDLVFKHDLSRVIQTAIKYGTAERKQEIARELKGSYVDLAESAYGKYLVVKLMHYGTAETKDMIISEFYGHVKKMVKHKEACFVIDDAYQRYASKKQRAAIVKEFYGPEYALFKDGTADASLKPIIDASPEKRPLIMKNLYDLFKQAVEKDMAFLGILHKPMLEYMLNVNPETSEAAEFIELVKEQLIHIAFTKDGAQVVMRCFAWGSAKDRKVLLKNIKPKLTDLYADEHGSLVVMTIQDVVDDTVLVSKTLFPEIQPKLDDGSAPVHAIARAPLLYPLMGRQSKLMHPEKFKQLEAIDQIRSQTSKKDPKIRQNELKKALSPALLKTVVAHASGLAKDPLGCQFISDVLLHADGDKTAALESVAKLAEGPEAIENQTLGRMLKTLVAEGAFNKATKSMQLTETPLEFHKYLLPIIKPDLLSWATSGNSYFVLTFLESERVPENEKAAIKKSLGGKKELEAIKTAKKEGNKGAEQILELVGKPKKK